MDTSYNEIKCFSFEEIPSFCLDSLPASITVSGIHRAVLEQDLEAVKHLVETGESVNTKEERCELAPLHLAVLKNSVGILDYLLSRDDIEIDPRCEGGSTPLQMASGLGAYESLKKLIDAGADVNLSDDKRVSPLHLSVRHPKVCHLLIQKNAFIDAVDSSGYTALHHAVQSGSLEAIHILLYYNADANVANDKHYTPFTLAIVQRNVEAQAALLEYVDDFNAPNDHPRYCNTLLGLALLYESPFLKEIVERGADMNYGDDIAMWEEDCPFMLCVHFVRVESAFKTVWERLRPYRVRSPINLCKLFDIKDTNYFNSVLQVIIESDNVELVVDSFTRHDNFGRFVCCFTNTKGSKMEQLVVLTYRLLEYGYRLNIYDVDRILSQYGPCELPRILPYMDVDYKRTVWLESCSLSFVCFRETGMYLHYLFDLDFGLVALVNGMSSGECAVRNEEVVLFLELSRDPRLMNALWLQFGDDEIMSEILNGVCKVPSLLELARNQARKHICATFGITNTCQFYTILDHSDIPSVYKDILTYRRKIYNV